MEGLDMNAGSKTLGRQSHVLLNDRRWPIVESIASTVLPVIILQFPTLPPSSSQSYK